MSDETKWSPEPWRRGEEHETKIEIDAADRAATLRPVATVHGALIIRPHAMHANARRIVACVNACAGIPTEALEAGALRDVVEVLEVIAARDTLFEANDAAFAPMVVRRMQEQAKIALRSLGRLP